MIEGRKAIATGVGRRKSLQTDASNPVGDRPDVDVRPDSKRPGRKLDEELRARMLVMVAISPEVDGAHRDIQLLTCRRRLEDEVEIEGLVLAGAVQGGARSSGEDCPDP